MAVAEIRPGGSLGEDGRYRLQRVLGTGGMASVWLATDARLGREVAIKVLSDVLALDDAYVRRFRREARIAAGLAHPHLVSIYDFSVRGSRPYLVMEYLGGGSLADRLRGGEQLPWEVEELAGELLGALGYIHGAGIVHRDIKPANVLIGEDRRPRLTDFGIAQPLDATRLTSTGMVVGTKRYLAPEVMRGEPAGVRSDLYSLGVLIAECLGEDPPAATRELVDRLVAERPEDRPGSAAEALAILEGGPTAPTQAAGTQPRQVAATEAMQTEGTQAMQADGTQATQADGTTATRVLAEESSWSATRIGRSERPAWAQRNRTTAAVVCAVALVVIVIVVLAASGGGGGSSTGSNSPGAVPARTPAGAPISEQLTRLDQAISQSKR